VSVSQLLLSYTNQNLHNIHIHTSHMHHVHRVITLCNVNDSTPSTATITGLLSSSFPGVDKKSSKFLHAVGIESISTLGNSTNTSVDVPNAVRCPYEDDSSFARVGGGNNNNNNTNVGLSETSARRIAGDARGEQFRWAGRGVDNNAVVGRKRGRNDNNGSSNSNSSSAYGPGGADSGNMPPPPVDVTCKTLFVGGLNRDPGGVVNVESLGRAFVVYNPIRLSLPPGKGFGFVEFSTHEEANNCLVNCGGGVEVMGVWLSLKWGKSGGGDNSNSNNNNNNNNKRTKENPKPSVLESDAPDSECLFFSFRKDVETVSLKTYCEIVRLLAEKCLEDAINSDGTDEGERITAVDEPALAVKAKVSDRSDAKRASLFFLKVSID